MYHDVSISIATTNGQVCGRRLNLEDLDIITGITAAAQAPAGMASSTYRT